MRYVLNFPPSVATGRNFAFKKNNSYSSNWNSVTDNATIASRLRSVIGGTLHEAYFTDNTDYLTTSGVSTGKKYLELSVSLVSEEIVNSVYIVQNQIIKIAFDDTRIEASYALKNLSTSATSPSFRLSQFGSDAEFNSWLKTNLEALYPGNSASVSGSLNVSGNQKKSGTKSIVFSSYVALGDLAIISGSVRRYLIVNGDNDFDYTFDGSDNFGINDTSVSLEERNALILSKLRTASGQTDAVIVGGFTNNGVTNSGFDFLMFSDAFAFFSISTPVTGTNATNTTIVASGAIATSIISSVVQIGGNSEVAFLYFNHSFGGSTMSQGLEMNSANQALLIPEKKPGNYDPTAIPFTCPDWRPTFNSNDAYDTFRASGRNANQWVAKIYEESTLSGEWRPSYNEMDKWLEGLCGYPVVDTAPTGVSSTGKRRREYLMPDKGRRSIRTYSADWGDVDKVVRCTYGLISALSMNSDPSQGTRGNISMMFRGAEGFNLPMSGTIDKLGGVAPDASSTATNGANLSNSSATDYASFTNLQTAIYNIGTASPLARIRLDILQAGSEGAKLRVYGGTTLANVGNTLIAVVDADETGIVAADVGSSLTFSWIKIVAETSAGSIRIGTANVISDFTYDEKDSLPILSNHWAVFRSVNRQDLYDGGGLPNSDAFMPTCDMWEFNVANIVNTHRSHNRTRTFASHVDSDALDVGASIRLPVDNQKVSVDMLDGANNYLSGPAWFLWEALCPLAPYRFAIESRMSVGANTPLESNNNVYERRFPLTRIVAEQGYNSVRFITEVAVPTV